MKELIGVLMVAAALWCVFDKYFIVLTGKTYNARVISSGDHTTRSAQRLEKGHQWVVDIDGKEIPVEVSTFSASPLQDSVMREIKSGSPKNVYIAVYYSGKRPNYAVQLSNIKTEFISAWLLVIGICLILLGN